MLHVVFPKLVLFISWYVTRLFIFNLGMDFKIGSFMPTSIRPSVRAFAHVSIRAQQKRCNPVFLKLNVSAISETPSIAEEKQSQGHIRRICHLQVIFYFAIVNVKGASIIATHTLSKFRKMDVLVNQDL